MRENIRLYYHKTDGGAEYLSSKHVPNSDEGAFPADFIVRLDGKPHLRFPDGVTPALIAAAPDMRDAVHSLLAEIDARCEDMRDAGCYEGTLLTAIEEARAALAKAEGE